MERKTTLPYNGPEVCSCGTPAAWMIQVLPEYTPRYRCQVCEDKFNQEIRWTYINEYSHEESIICPYCDKVYSDSWDIAEADREEYECERCGRAFDIEVHRTVSYSTTRSLSEMPPDWNEEDEE